jgi:hypothetical protein
MIEKSNRSPGRLHLGSVGFLGFALLLPPDGVFHLAIVGIYCREFTCSVRVNPASSIPSCLTGL